jgi:hypothetical protein
MEAEESGQVQLTKTLMGPLLNSEPMVLNFAKMIFIRLYGEADVAEQQPFKVVDENTYWRVEGTWDKSGHYAGRLFLRVRKSDCWVELFGHDYPMNIPAEVQALIDQSKAGKTGVKD